jgi:hypothetical protein
MTRVYLLPNAIVPVWGLALLVRLFLQSKS